MDRVLSYRKMSVPLKLTVKDHHYATVLRKTGTLPPEIMFDEKYVHIACTRYARILCLMFHTIPDMALSIGAS